MESSKAGRERFGEWLLSHGKAQFSFDAEISNLTNRSRGGIRNELPAFDLWPNILPTLRLVEKVREKFGPVTINSAYRGPAYNRAIGGAASSIHMKFQALDFYGSSGTPTLWADFLKTLRADGMFKGGIGIYKNFVHVDTRGTNADWKG